ncbi:hypothetical protein [Halodesulfovibrio sp. MK-HDV]|uniref:hypothetical protein n=1 Tax=Halodesulfovibrio sp. MK-HDV TaxID=2599925 RepID=UPI00136EFEC2|nr:hypothetical protein [Halodesulfovibrio sp. MK-HDV]KAF1077670.1 hypothetical protein MKHDV_00126 [Halodesulfovibrio sp. MK-HDV]
MLENNKNAVTVIYSGGDIQVPFLFYDQDDLVVLYEITPKTLGTDYTVTGAGNEAGGKVALVTQPASGTRVTVIRKVDFTQLLQIPANGIIPEGALNRALDRIVMMIQQLEERANRSVTYPEGTEKTKVANAGEMLDAIEQAQLDINNAVNVATATLESSNTALVASNKALDDAEAKRVQVNNDGDAQVERILAEGNKQDSRVETEGDKQHSRVETEGNEQASRITTEGNSQYNRVVSLRDSAVALVDTHKVEGVSSVDAAKQQALDTIRAMPEYLPNHEAILQAQIENIFGGKVVGKSGKWKFVSSDTITATGVGYVQGWTVGALTGISFAEGETPNWNDCVKETINGWRKVAITFGDSGEPYVVNHIWRQLRLHPTYGDVCWDFTTGKGYKVLVCLESIDPADQQVGTRDVTEYLLGGCSAVYPKYAGKKVIEFSAGKIFLKARACTWRGSGYNPPTISRNDVLTIVFHHVYNPITPKIRIGVKQDYGNDDSPWVVLGDFSTTYDESTKTVTWSGALSTAPWDFEEMDYYLMMQGGEVVAMDGADTVYASIESAAYGLNDEAAIFRYHGEWFTGGGGQATMYDNEFSLPPEASSIIPLNSYGIFNVGYWKGKEWKSQLLGDARFDDAGTTVSRLVLKMADKVVGGLSTLEVRKADDTWQEFTIGYEANSLEYRFNEQQNYAIINVGSSYAVLGYTSEEDMRRNASVRAKYQASARVWRPDHSDVNFSTPDEKVLFLATYGRGTGSLVHDLIGHVPTVNGGTNSNWAAILASADNHLARTIGTSRYQSLNPRYPEPNSIAVLFRLFPREGTLWMQARFKELIYNGGMDWGDNHILDENGSDYLTTTTDDNGNVVLQGVMSYDTGIPA